MTPCSAQTILDALPPLEVQLESTVCIDAVVSRMMAMFAGWFLTPRMAEVAVAEMVIWPMPKMRAKNVGTIACSFTWMALASSGPTHAAWYKDVWRQVYLG